jgi:hypothetical protein
MSKRERVCEQVVVGRLGQRQKLDGAVGRLPPGAVGGEQM